MATLHRLLWGVEPQGSPLRDWKARPWEVPAVGLPTRVAAFLFAESQVQAPPAGWSSTAGPLTWCFDRGHDLLALGRRYQFGFARLPWRNEGAPPMLEEQPLVQRVPQWEVAPHAAYLLPFVVAGDPAKVRAEAYLAYCDVLLLLTAIDGGESVLDRLAVGGAGTVPFEDRWDWRSRIHLPGAVWQLMERTLRWVDSPQADLGDVPIRLLEELRECSPSSLSPEDFAFERVDLRLNTELEAEIVRTVRPLGAADGDLPGQLLLDPDELQECLVVRMAQVSRWPDRLSVMKGFPAMDSTSSVQVMEQVAAAFHAPDHSGYAHGPDLVLLPEATIPQPEVQTVRDLVSQTGRASLAGLYWRALPPAYPPSGSTTPFTRWFVNEAELVLPADGGDRGPRSVRWYRVRKPVPAHIETALALALTAQSGGPTSWAMLPGHRWYRFLHRSWGDFTIAICADLLDAAPWRSLRGELLHLFMVAFNQDVDLYESLTWVRAYENYVNLVAVNHGSDGGSFLWTPRRSRDRELARLRGSKLFLTADVELPVKALLDAQRNGTESAVQSLVEWWATEKRAKSPYKAPPPGFVRRALVEGVKTAAGRESRDTPEARRV